MEKATILQLLPPKNPTKEEIVAFLSTKLLFLEDTAAIKEISGEEAEARGILRRLEGEKFIFSKIDTKKQYTGPKYAIVAMSKNAVIGKNGELPWKGDKSVAEAAIADMQDFVRKTIGKVCIAGRKTADSLVYLRKRLLFVVSTTMQPSFARPYVFDSFVKAEKMARELGLPPVYIGGLACYEHFFETPSIGDIAYVNIIEKNYEGDVKWLTDAKKSIIPLGWSATGPCEYTEDVNGLCHFTFEYGVPYHTQVTRGVWGPISRPAKSEK